MKPNSVANREATTPESGSYAGISFDSVMPGALTSSARNACKGRESGGFPLGSDAKRSESHDRGVVERDGGRGSDLGSDSLPNQQAGSECAHERWSLRTASAPLVCTDCGQIARRGALLVAFAALLAISVALALPHSASALKDGSRIKPAQRCWTYVFTDHGPAPCKLKPRRTVKAWKFETTRGWQTLPAQAPYSNPAAGVLAWPSPPPFAQQADVSEGTTVRVVTVGER